MRFIDICVPLLLHDGWYFNVLRGIVDWSNAFLYKGIPLMALRALPQEFGAAISAPDAYVWVKVEDGIMREFNIASNNLGAKI